MKEYDTVIRDQLERGIIEENDPADIIYHTTQ